MLFFSSYQGEKTIRKRLKCGGRERRGGKLYPEMFSVRLLHDYERAEGAKDTQGHQGQTRGLF
jgi:hypothetical protein